MPRTSLLAVVAVAVAGAACSAPDATARVVAAANPSPVAPEVSWQPCPPAGFECGVLTVPVRHDDPRSPTIGVALIRRPAGDPARRLGALVVNPGGPGASGVDFAAVVAGRLDPAVTDRFDVVGFDPRGVSRSAPVRCPWDLQAGPAPCPDPLAAEVGTVRVADDLELLRRALGEPALTFYGASYGTRIGAVYAMRHPSRVRAMVLDAADGQAVDLGRFHLEQAETLERALQRFAVWCATTVCPLRPDPATRASAVLARVGPDDPPLAAALVGLLTDPASWADLAEVLAAIDDGDLERFLAAFARATPDAVAVEVPPGGTNNADDLNRLVTCADTADRVGPAEAEALGVELRRRAPTFAALFTRLLTACDGVPDAVTPIGPLTISTAAPVLVLATTGDPATPAAWAGSLAAAFPRGVLVTWQGEGHTAYLRSPCVTALVDRFLTDLVAPPRGTTCPAGSVSS